MRTVIVFIGLLLGGVLNALPGYGQVVRGTVRDSSGHAVDELQPVVVRRRRPMLRTSGDTLSYNVADFTRAQDRVIGDVIRRLPGISVAADGTITYNNKPVSGVYIGGDNLLDDKYTIATNTIPQGIVDQVQVIDNHQPIRVLQNKVTSDAVALNLTLKKGAGLRLLGQESVGAGLPGKYDLDLNALLFKDGYKAINYLKGNNTGEDLDLASHNSASTQQRIGNDIPATMLSLGAVNDPALARQRYLFNHASSASANDLFNLKNGLQVRMNAWYLRDRQQQDYSQHSTTFLPGDTIQYSEVQHNRFEPSLMHAQLTVNLNKEKCYLNEVLLADDSRRVNYSDLNTNGTLVNQALRDHSLSFSNELDWIGSVRSNVVVEGYSYVSHTAEPEDRRIGPGYNAGLFNHGVGYAQLVQTVDVPAWFTNNYISVRVPGNTVTGSLRTGISVQSQALSSGLSVVQANNTVNRESDSSVNDLDWTRRRLYAEAAFDIPGRRLKLALTLPFTLQQLNYSDIGYALSKGLSSRYFDPQLRLRYQTGTEHYLTFQYSYRNEVAGIEEVYPGYILKDYRTLYANNADLTVRQDQLVTAGFNYRKTLTLFFFSLYATYNHISANNISSSVITNSLQQRVVLPYPNSADVGTVSGSVSKYSFGWKTTFGCEGQWQDSRSVQLQNGVLLPFHMTAGTLTLSALTKVDDRLNFSYSITGKQMAGTPGERVNQLLQQAEIYYYPAADLELKLSGEHYFTGRTGNAYFTDAHAKYRIKKWKADLQLDATNLLNVKTYKALYLSVNTLTASSYRLPGRVILLKVLFNL